MTSKTAGGEPRVGSMTKRETKSLNYGGLFLCGTKFVLVCCSLMFFEQFSPNDVIERHSDLAAVSSFTPTLHYIVSNSDQILTSHF